VIETVSLKVYRGGISDTSLVDQSDRANADISETDLELGPGDFISIEYTGGTPGAIMNFRAEGDEINSRFA
jgi:hypothetical protein